MTALIFRISFLQCLDASVIGIWIKEVFKFVADEKRKYEQALDRYQTLILDFWICLLKKRKPYA